MRWKINPTLSFEKDAKRLEKKYRSLKNDLRKFGQSLMIDPFQGDELTPGIRKIRMAIESKGGGKSKGARIITLTYYISEEDGEIVMLLIYDHNQADTVDANIIKKICKLLGYDIEKLEKEGKLKVKK